MIANRARRSPWSPFKPRSAVKEKHWTNGIIVYKPGGCHIDIAIVGTHPTSLLGI